MCLCFFYLFKAYDIAFKPVEHCVQIIKEDDHVEAGFVEAIHEMEEAAKKALTSHFPSDSDTKKVADGHRKLNEFANKECAKHTTRTRPTIHAKVLDLLKECEKLQDDFNIAYAEAINPTE